ncbi:mitochondrial rRNA methyltransferase 1 [Phyllostomus discolor]|uniref:Mitochondrial rRNA methyltransferase 1 n=1 Tax=Phyllostomus discolor TaxID=89673 RepID=A0A834DX32_9CHIR|nr:mitochondrial rRNA methyltransferase 1 [Phyllostomus discolor]
MTWRLPRGPPAVWNFCLACPRVFWLCGPPAAGWPGSCSRPAGPGCKEGVPSCSVWLKHGTFQFYGPDGRSWTPCAATRSTRASAWSCPLTPVVSKASAGAMEVMDVFFTDDLDNFLQARARQGWLVAGTVGCPGPEISPSSGVPITSCLEFLWDRPTLLVLGNEGSGLSPEVQASCQLLLTILPGRQLPPGLESLNVSVAAGILLHSICSQRKSIPEEGKRGQLLQGPRESSAMAEGPRVAQDPGQSSGPEKVRQGGD